MSTPVDWYSEAGRQYAELLRMDGYQAALKADTWPDNPHLDDEEQSMSRHFIDGIVKYLKLRREGSLFAPES